MIDINALAGQYAGKLITVHGVFNAVLPAGSTFHPYTDKHPTPSAGFVFVNKGSGSFTFNGTVYEVNAGMVVHGGKQMVLTMTTGESQLEYVLIRYSLHDAAPHVSLPASSLINQHFVLEPGTSPQIAELLRHIYESFYTPGNMAWIRTNYLFQTILYETFTCCLNRMNDTGKETVEQARIYIHSRYMEPMSLQKLAGRYGTSVKSFSYLFHKYTGVFPIDYLIQHRMKRAQELLMKGDYTIKEVAASVGYEDALYFSRLYKKHYGYAPSQSRRN